jgi:hypothetical protein
MRALTLLALCASTFLLNAAPPVVKVEKSGAERTLVTIETSGGIAGDKYNASLKKNLEISGYFKVGPNGQIRVKGTPG